MYNLVHNFNKYSVSNFNEISSLDSKFDTLEKFHNHFKKLKDVKKASVLYDDLIKIYKKKYDQTFKSKDKDSRLKHDYKNLKDLEYQPDQPHSLIN